MEQKPGGPERPLSDLGFRTYVSYWSRRIIEYLLSLNGDLSTLSIQKIVEKTGMIEDDILYVLRNQKILRGETLNCDPEYLESLLKLTGRPGRKIFLEKMRWKPFIAAMET